MPPRLHQLHPKALLAISGRPATAGASLPAITSSPVSSLSTQNASHESPSTPVRNNSHIQKTLPRHDGGHRSFSSLDRPPPLYPGHIPITGPERLVLALGSTLYSFFTPRRPDLIALCSETTTPTSLLRSLRDTMLLSPSGRAILRERPRISSKTVDIPHLRTLPPTTLGKIYADWLDREKVTPDTRDPVRHVSDPELAYVLQRYRESHDLYHVLLAEKGMPAFLEGEVVVKAFEFAALGLPMTGLATLSAVKLPQEQRRRVLWGGRGGAGDVETRLQEESDPNITTDSSSFFSSSSLTPSQSQGQPWLLYALSQGLNTHTSPASSLLNIYWEHEWTTPVSELRARLGINLPVGVGDLREVRRRERERKKRMEKERVERMEGL